MVHPTAQHQHMEILEEHFCDEEFVRYVQAYESDMRRFEELMNEKEND